MLFAYKLVTCISVLLSLCVSFSEASESGNILLINDTPYTWIRTRFSSVYLGGWNFTDFVAPGEPCRISITSAFADSYRFSGENVTVPVKFYTGFTASPYKDKASVSYLLKSTEGQGFKLQAGYDSDSQQFGIFAYTRNITTDQYPLGTNITLGFTDNSTTVFKLSGDTSSFTISQDSTPSS